VEFTLAVEGEPFLAGLNGIDKAISAFLYISFIAHLEYAEVIPVFMICTSNNPYSRLRDGYKAMA
jgi:hypothetical protein